MALCDKKKGEIQTPELRKGKQKPTHLFQQLATMVIVSPLTEGGSLSTWPFMSYT